MLTRGHVQVLDLSSASRQCARERGEVGVEDGVFVVAEDLLAVAVAAQHEARRDALTVLARRQRPRQLREFAATSRRRRLDQIRHLARDRGGEVELRDELLDRRATAERVLGVADPDAQ